MFSNHYFSTSAIKSRNGSRIFCSYFRAFSCISRSIVQSLHILSMGKSEFITNFRCVFVLILLFHSTIEIVGVIREIQLRQILVRQRSLSAHQLLLRSSNSLFHNYVKMLWKKDEKIVGPYRRRTYNMIAKVITGNPYRHSRDIYKKTSVFPLQPFWTFATR